MPATPSSPSEKSGNDSDVGTGSEEHTKHTPKQIQATSSSAPSLISLSTPSPSPSQSSSGPSIHGSNGTNSSSSSASTSSTSPRVIVTTSSSSSSATPSSSSSSRLEDFEVLSLLGRGSFGVCYKVRRLGDDQIYVLKQINISFMNAREQREAINEVQIMASVDSPHVVRYFDSFLAKRCDEHNPSIQYDTLNIVMEYCERGDLHSELRKREGLLLEEENVWKYFIQIALGLYDLHAKKILHRDLKSLNLFLSAADQIKIGDLGVARVLGHGSLSRYAETIVGTPYYMSPELCEEKPYNEKSDVWALGILLYELCTLRYPFDAGNHGALILKILRGTRPQISANYSSRLRRLIDWCLKKDSAQRPSVCELLASPAVFHKAAQLDIDVPEEVKECAASKEDEREKRARRRWMRKQAKEKEKSREKEKLKEVKEKWKNQQHQRPPSSRKDRPRRIIKYDTQLMYAMQNPPQQIPSPPHTAAAPSSSSTSTPPSRSDRIVMHQPQLILEEKENTQADGLLDEFSSSDGDGKARAIHDAQLRARDRVQQQRAAVALERQRQLAHYEDLVASGIIVPRRASGKLFRGNVFGKSAAVLGISGNEDQEIELDAKDVNDPLDPAGLLAIAPIRLLQAVPNALPVQSPPFSPPPPPSGLAALISGQLYQPLALSGGYAQKYETIHHTFSPPTQRFPSSPKRAVKPSALRLQHLNFHRVNSDPSTPSQPPLQPFQTQDCTLASSPSRSAISAPPALPAVDIHPLHQHARLTSPSSSPLLPTPPPAVNAQQVRIVQRGKLPAVRGAHRQRGNGRTVVVAALQPAANTSAVMLNQPPHRYKATRGSSVCRYTIFNMEPSPLIEFNRRKGVKQKERQKSLEQIAVIGHAMNAGIDDTHADSTKNTQIQPAVLTMQTQADTLQAQQALDTEDHEEDEHNNDHDLSSTTASAAHVNDDDHVESMAKSSDCDHADSEDDIVVDQEADGLTAPVTAATAAGDSAQELPNQIGNSSPSCPPEEVFESSASTRMSMHTPSENDDVLYDGEEQHNNCNNPSSSHHLPDSGIQCVQSTFRRRGGVCMHVREYSEISGTSEDDDEEEYDVDDLSESDTAQRQQLDELSVEQPHFEFASCNSSSSSACSSPSADMTDDSPASTSHAELNSQYSSLCSRVAAVQQSLQILISAQSLSSMRQVWLQHSAESDKLKSGAQEGVVVDDEIAVEQRMWTALSKVLGPNQYDAILRFCHLMALEQEKFDFQEKLRRTAVKFPQL